MKTLREIIDEIGAGYSGEKDITAIRLYLEQDDMLTNGINLLTTICKKQSNDLMRFKTRTLSNLSSPTEFYYKEYDLDTAYMLDMLTRRIQLDEPMRPKDVEWMKKFDIKTAKSPFWHDLSEAIKLAQDPNYKVNFFTYDPRGSI